MPVVFRATATTGLSLAAWFRKEGSNGALGDWWDENGSAFAVSPSSADKSIALTESPNGYYHGYKSALSTYTGKGIVYIVNTATYTSLGHAEVYLVNGEEVVAGAKLAQIDNLALEATSQSIKTKTDTIVSGGATAAAVSAVAADVTTILSNTNTTNSRLTNTRAGYLDNLTNLDAAITTRAASATVVGLATQASVDTIDTNVDTLLTRLSAGRATALDNLTYLDASVAAVKAKTDLITSGFATATDLATVDTNIDTLLTRLSATRAGYLDSIPSLATTVDLATVDTNVDTLVTRLTATRAGYLDNLTNLDDNVAGVQTDVTTLLTRLTGTRAGYLDNLTNLDAAITSRASSASVASLATAAALTTVDNNVTAILADTNELQTDWANGGRLDLLVDAILADTNDLETDWNNGGRLDTLLDTAAAGGGSVVFADKTPTADRTWILKSAADSPTASNIITLAAGSSVLVAMNFTALLPAGVGIYTVDSAVDQTDPTDITIDNLARSQDATSAIFTVADMTAGNSHKIKVTITTTDNQQLVGYGLIEVT